MRQNELLRLLAAGHTNSQIARQLGTSEGTVRSHPETFTNGCRSPAAPPRSPAPSPTWWHSSTARLRGTRRTVQNRCSGPRQGPAY